MNHPFSPKVRWRGLNQTMESKLSLFIQDHQQACPTIGDGIIRCHYKGYFSNGDA